MFAPRFNDPHMDPVSKPAASSQQHSGHGHSGHGQNQDSTLQSGPYKGYSLAAVVPSAQMGVHPLAAKATVQNAHAVQNSPSTNPYAQGGYNHGGGHHHQAPMSTALGPQQFAGPQFQTPLVGPSSLGGGVSQHEAAYAAGVAAYQAQQAAQGGYGGVDRTFTGRSFSVDFGAGRVLCGRVLCLAMLHCPVCDQLLSVCVRQMISPAMEDSL